MLEFQDFFSACAGQWKTERTYHSVLSGEIERSYTEFRVNTLDSSEKQRILSGSESSEGFDTLTLDGDVAQVNKTCPGFAIAFDTRSETGEEVSMSLKALFVPDNQVTADISLPEFAHLPVAASVSNADSEVIQGFYLRDQGYSEAGAIAGRFTYHPIRHTLEMITYYRRSVAVDQMRLIAPDLRLRTIVTYQKPPAGEPPTVIDLVGFGVEHKTPAAS
ncbi:MAG: phycobiliprotein lyase [Elainellaceae cyanobacterium]